jgi:hypothetical protein
MKNTATVDLGNGNVKSLQFPPSQQDTFISGLEQIADAQDLAVKLMIQSDRRGQIFSGYRLPGCEWVMC